MARDPEVQRALAFLGDLDSSPGTEDIRVAAMICFESLPIAVRDIVNETPIDYIALARRWNMGVLTEAQLLIQAREMQRWVLDAERRFMTKELQKIT